MVRRADSGGPGQPGKRKGPPARPGSAPVAGKRTQLARALSKLGICSRGEAVRRIAAGGVRVNGRIARDPEAWVELGKDRIEASAEAKGASTGERIAPAPLAPAERLYYRMHKPPGYVTTRSDELGRETVYDLLPPEAAAAWVFPVGRLDRDSEGLLLLTNDGPWSDRLTDPRSHVDKVYRVKLDARPREEDLAAFRAGVVIEGRKTLPAKVESEGSDWCRVTLSEGRNRQIRRMFHALGYKVKRLVRVSIGSLELGDMRPGEVRPLERKWVAALGKASKG
jgi:23S rRNA pseudouridine2605 synthase